ncbi:MAG: barstar family protein [Ndongobacter sp.]|nr:barstar family protein [Ndongobacter sp.]
MKHYQLSGERFSNRHKAYQYLSDVFSFPEYTGKNLDALWDALSDLAPFHLTLVNGRALPKNLQEYGLSMLDLFADLSEEFEGVFELHW